jgi:hypothetical protein
MFILSHETTYNPNQKGNAMTDFEYTPENTTTILAAYAAVREDTYEARSAVVQELADTYGVKVHRIRAKLVSEKVYIAKAPAAAKAANGKSKEDYVKALSAVLGKDVPSFMNASKRDLVTLWTFIVSASDKQEADGS